MKLFSLYCFVFWLMLLVVINMSNRTIIELNHDRCPHDNDEELLAWARSMRYYMGNADESYLPDGVTFLHYRHHSQNCPLPIPPQKSRIQRGILAYIKKPIDPSYLNLPEADGIPGLYNNIEKVARALCTHEYDNNKVYDTLGETDTDAMRLWRENGREGPVDSKDTFRSAARVAIEANEF